MSSMRVRYQTIEFGDVDIHVRSLRDRQQFADVDGVAEALGISSATWSLFGVIWDSGEVLANLMFDYEVAGKRVLEVGCGLGLASLVLNHRLADVTATDYHPEAEQFLRHNVALNNGNKIPFVRTDWADHGSGLGEFDLVIGSDVLYEPGHAELLSAFVDQHTKPDAEVILVDPGRAHHQRFSRIMMALGYAHRRYKPETSDYLTKPFRGWIHRYCRDDAVKESV